MDKIKGRKFSRQKRTAKRKHPKSRPVKVQKHDPMDMTIHHRKPTGEGGEDIPSNRSKVMRFKHVAWHSLFRSLPAPEALARLEIFYHAFGPNKNLKIFQRDLLLKRIGNKWWQDRKERSWIALFGNRSLSSILREVNKIWIDPDYEASCIMEQIETVKVGLITKKV